MESNDKLERLLEQMYAQESLHDKDIDTKDIIDEEWTKFEAEHFRGEKRERLRVGERSSGMVRGERLPLRKIAAMIVGILMLSGIAYAAVQMIRSQETGGRSQETVAVANSQLSTPNSQLAEQDSTLMKPIVYEDTELTTILDDIATFYQVEPVYKNEATKHIRLYFTWDKKQNIDNIIDTFNKFERINITRYDKILIIE